MKTYVINIPRRTDRLERFLSVNTEYLHDYEIIEGVDGKEIFYDDLLELGYDTNKNWRDRCEFFQRPLLHGDIGCLMSHIKVWERIIEDGKPALILEDDCKLLAHIDVAAQLSEPYDLFYLEFNEMDERWKYHPDRNITENIVKPCYPYLLSSYIMTPYAATVFLNGGIKENMIPDDEYVPRMLQWVNAAGCHEGFKLAEQYWREVVGSDIEPSDDSCYFIDFDTHVLTSHDDHSKSYILEYTAREHGFHVTNVTKGFFTWDTEYPGGGKKLIDLRNYIDENDLPDNDVILFTDAFDVFYQAELDFIVRRYLSMHKEVVFAAEDNLWPDTSVLHPPHYSKYKYLNSGAFIGRVGTLRKMLGDYIHETDDDQLYLQKTFLEPIYNCGLDYEAYIFQCWDDALVIQDGRVYNPIYGGYPCVIHGNGDYLVKQKWNNLYEEFNECTMTNPVPPPEPLISSERYFSHYAQVNKFEILADDILMIDCMSPETCRKWIDKAERLGNFAQDPNDPVPSHDIHLKTIGLFEEMETFMKEQAATIIDAYWSPQTWMGIRKAFVMKYSQSSQINLPIHVDHSLITGSVKLNDDYKGSVLSWPKQNFNNSEVPIGKMILFPGMVTHPHRVSDLESGVKYSATIWGSRWENDIYDP